MRCAPRWTPVDSMPSASMSPVSRMSARRRSYARRWRLMRRASPQRRVAIVLANYPSRDGRLANGVGLDTPQSLVDVLGAMRGAGYAIENMPGDAASMMQLLQAGPTNALEDRGARAGG